MYKSNEIWLGKKVWVFPGWKNTTGTKQEINESQKLLVPVVYVDPKKRFFTVEYTYTTRELFGRQGVYKFRESFSMVDENRLASKRGGGYAVQKLQDYNDD